MGKKIPILHEVNTWYYDKEITLLCSNEISNPHFNTFISREIKKGNKNRQTSTKKISLLQSSVPFPFPPGAELKWFLRVPPGGARAEQKSTARIPVQNKKEQLRARKERQLNEVN